jgi:hypothetical protein
MSEKELLYQIISREVDNILGNINPALRMFNSVATNYVISIVDPYVDAFIANSDNKKIDTDAANKFVKNEINDKVDSFMKKFKEESEKQYNDL